MKTPARHLCLGAAFALVATLLAATWARSADEQPAPAGQSAAAPVADAPTPAPTVAKPDQAPAAPAPQTATEPAEKPELRRLDVPAETKTEAPDAVPASDSAGKKTEAPAAEKPDHHPQHKGRNLSFGHKQYHHSDNSRVTFGGDSRLEEGEEADAVVSIFGSSTSDGNVGDAVVSVLGSSTSNGNVGDAVVSVLGSTRVAGGRVGGAAVAVVGDTYVNTHVGEAAVAVLGNVELGPKAEVDGDVVSVGGTVKRDAGAIVHGNVQNVAIGPVFGGFGGMDWLQAWVKQCLLHVRPLAFGPHLLWAWWIALGFLGLYALIALVFGGAVEKCAQTLEQRPGYSLLAAVLTVLITPIAIILLCVTVIGVALVPFIAAGLFFANLFGKAVILACIGRGLVRLVDRNAAMHAALTVLIGGAVVLLLYTVPILGFIVYKVVGVLGLGVVVYTLLLSAKRKPAPPAVPPAAGGGIVPGPVPPVAPSPESVGVVAAVSGAEAAATAEGVVPPVAPAAIPPPVAISASTFARAGFWIRLAASAIDAIIVGIAIGFLPHVLRPNYLLLFAGYSAVLWALKGTTVGGIVCSLKVVRLDDRRVDWMTALVRALGAFLSLFAAGLGFIWVAFDEQKQSWHDKIAGTTIVTVPKGVSLV
ncbi:MAG TPA: RDD family protein [Opitutus sp.]|nr:RDD family protein [Opitutus sp.]